jgi:hypothetical protein
MIRPVRGHVQCRRLPRTFERGAKPRLAVVLDGYGVVVAKRAGAGPAKAARFDPGETLATDDIVAEPDLGFRSAEVSLPGADCEYSSVDRR